MKYALILITFSMSACSLFEKKPDEPSIPTPIDRGEFKPGPVCVDGKCCNAPGGWCSSDKQCHSSALKCPRVR